MTNGSIKVVTLFSMSQFILIIMGKRRVFVARNIFVQFCHVGRKVRVNFASDSLFPLKMAAPERADVINTRNSCTVWGQVSTFSATVTRPHSEEGKRVCAPGRTKPPPAILSESLLTILSLPSTAQVLVKLRRIIRGTIVCIVFI